MSETDTINTKDNKPNSSKQGKEYSNRVRVINASGNPKAGKRLAAYLKKKGLSVEVITESARITANSLIVLNTCNKELISISKVNKFPFEYS